MSNPQSTAKIAGHPLHPLLVTLPVGFFTATLFFDILYWLQQSDAFATGAIWLLGAGLAGALLAALAGLVDFAGDPRIRALNKAWFHAIGNVLLVMIEAYNFYGRYRGGAIIPQGLTLSIIAVVVMLVNGWLGGELVFRDRVAVRDK